MTNQEFNNKYKDYIEPGFDGCELDNEEALNYLDNEFQELINIPDFKFSQIKSKFNWFCFYCIGIHSKKITQITDKLKEIYGRNTN